MTSSENGGVSGPEEVQFYSVHAQELKQSQRHKILKFIEHNCVSWDREKRVFIVAHIPGYNKTDYEITKENGQFVCNCQYCNLRVRKGETPSCSHIGAIYESLARDNRRRGVGKFTQTRLDA